MSKPSTAAQRRYIEALAAGAGAAFEGFFNDAAQINHNGPIAADETPTQASRRLTKTAASALIDAMLTAGITPARIPRQFGKTPFLHERVPETLEPVKAQIHDDLTH